MLKIMSYNTLFGGFDGAESSRFDLQVDIIREADPDILLVQEWKGFLAEGGKRMFEAERRLHRRALVASAPVTGQNTAILLKPGIEILGFEVDADHFHHAAAIATLRVPGLDSPLTAISVHLCPNGPHVRMREASYLVNHAIDDAYVIIGGDFNSPSPHDEAPDFDALPARFRVRYTDKKGKPHRDVLAGLERAGFVDIGHRLQGNDTATVPGVAFKGSEFAPFRCDYFLASRAFGALAESYRVLRDTDALDHASDHYPILAAFNSVAR